MQVEFVRFKASDSLELQGWLSNTKGDTAVIHVHGMSGNGYENYFLDKLRQMYTDKGISLFTIDTRGRGIISSFWQGGKIDSWGEGTKLGGSCFEIFEESACDIQGAVEYLQSLGKSKIILQGHSLGCSKVVNYCMNSSGQEIIKVVLLAPTDMARWAATDSRHEEYLQRAKKLLAEGKGKELVDAQCWLDKTPLSAQTYPTICEAGSSADIYGEREDGALLGRLEHPALIVYGTADIGITTIDGTIQKWQERTESIKHPNTSIATIDGASHSFKSYEKDLSQAIGQFIEN